MFVENQDAIERALKSDLNRPTFEALYYDILLPIHEIDSLISNIYKYVSPESRSFNLLTFPSTDQIYREPLGLVLVIGTWNYPIMLSLIPVAGAIAAGNTVILKPCNISSHSARLMADLIPKYMDPKVISVVGTAMRGDRDTTAELLKHKFDHIFFTGSPSVGKIIMQGAAEHLTPVTLELGGKNPVFVDKDADLNLAAKRCVWGRNMNAGQQCISPDYVLCHKDVIKQFGDFCSRWVKDLYMDGGSSAKDNGNLGRIVGDKQMERIIGLLKGHGGSVVCGGGFEEKERYVEPSVIKVGVDSPAMEEETFGPILWLVEVGSMEEGIEYVNKRDKPLSMYIFSKSRETQEKILYNTSAGGVTVNGTLFHVAHPDLPFGGVGASGMGKYHGRETFNTFTHEKPVLRKNNIPDGGLLSDPMFIYPPWRPWKLEVVKWLAKII